MNKRKNFIKKLLYTPLLFAVILAVNNTSLADDRIVVPVPQTQDINNANFYNLSNKRTGAAIYNEGNVTVHNTEFLNNSINSTETINPNDYYAKGGAIANLGQMHIEESLFENNSSSIYTLTSDMYENGNYTSNYESSLHVGNGGAIYNQADLTINNTSFTNNLAGESGGAIANSVDGTLKIAGNTMFANNIVNSQFSEKITYNINNEILNGHHNGYLGSGGAISNSGELKIDGATFISNNAAVYGGAIFSESDATLEINNTIFEKNTAESYFFDKDYNFEPDNSYTVYEDQGLMGLGGAIYSIGETTIKNSTFKNNKAGVDGGAINFMTNGSTQNDNAVIEKTSFISNSAGAQGGAIYSEKTLDIKNSTFIDNEVNGNKEACDELTSGGAIYTSKSLNISDSEFINNRSAWLGGAIEVYTGADNKLNINNSNFTGNSAFSSDGAGGAIYTNVATNISNSKFTNNYSGDAGGAVYFYEPITNVKSTINDSMFVSNNAHNNGGAISIANNNLSITDTSFVNNTAEKGGAIFYTVGSQTEDNSELNIIAKNNNVEFKGNTAKLGADIALEGASILNLNATKDKSITFDGGIQSIDYLETNTSEVEKYSPSININKNNIIENSTGKIIFNAPVIPVPNSNLAVNVYDGTLELSKDSNLDNTNLTLNNGATLNLQNNEVGTMNLNSIIANNANIAIDIDAKNTNIDTILANHDSKGSLNLSSVNFLSDFIKDKNNATITFANNGMSKDLAITTNTDLNIMTNQYMYTVNADGVNLNITRLVDDSNNTVEIDGFTLAINGSGTVSQNNTDITLSDDRAFSANNNIKISGSGLDSGWTGELGGNSLIINGNGYELDGNKNVGININNGQKLEINDIKMVNFGTKTEMEGAITIKGGGYLEINANNNDVSIENITSESNIINAIYFDGSNANANFNVANDKIIKIGNDIRSAYNSNELTLRGLGKIIFDGIVDPITVNNENKDTIHNNYIDDVNYNLNAGSVTFTDDKFLANQNGNLNSINFNGGMLNIANNAVNNIVLANLSLNKTSNISVDADLAIEKMDTISAQNYNITDGTLNVSDINLLSDANKEQTVITFASDELKDSITTSVTDVAYSPVYRYGVDYDATTGAFSFTRGSSSNYTNVNPSIMVSSVAAQAGGYLTLLNAYEQAFNNMDIKMLMSREQREALKNRNKFAYTGNPTFAPTMLPEENKGVWARPYSTFESVALRGGPRVSNVMYGTFFGADSEIKELGHGFDGVFSLYAGYNGSHQAYQGNSIYQNGGTLGATGTLYKGNWFGALTANAGANAADASTMYGSENFGMLLAGTALKTGYNLELFSNKMILQPSYLMSYSFVNTFDYHNATGTNISSDPLNAIQVVPGIKFIGNCPNGWQPYLGFNFIWNIIDKTKFMANDVSLPQLAVRPYVEYGLGVQKRWGERFTGFGQAMFRSGGREGVSFSVGIRTKIGK